MDVTLSPVRVLNLSADSQNLQGWKSFKNHCFYKISECGKQREEERHCNCLEEMVGEFLLSECEEIVKTVGNFTLSSGYRQRTVVMKQPSLPQILHENACLKYSIPKIGL